MNKWSLVMAERLKAQREKRGLSHVALSKALNEKYGVEISRDSLMNYEIVDPEHNKAYKNEGMSVKYLRCFSDFYEVSTDYLLGITDIKSLDADIASAARTTGLNEKAISYLSKAKKYPINSGGKWLKLWSELIISSSATIAFVGLENYGNARIAEIVYDYFWFLWHPEEKNAKPISAEEYFAFVEDRTALSAEEEEKEREERLEVGRITMAKMREDIFSFAANNQLSSGLREQITLICNYWSDMDNAVVEALYNSDTSLIQIYRYNTSREFESLTDELAQGMIDEFISNYPQFKDGDTNA